MSFSLATKVNNIEGTTSLLMDNLQDLATNEAVAINLMSYYTKSACDTTFVLRNNPTFTGTASGLMPAMVGLGKVTRTSPFLRPQLPP